MPKVPLYIKNRKLSDTKEPHNKMLTKAAKRQAASIADLAKEYCHHISEPEMEEVERRLRKELHLGAGWALGSNIWGAVENSDTKLAIQKSSKLHIDAARFVWKMTDFITSSNDRFKRHLPVILKRAGMKITPKFDLSIAVYKSMFKSNNRRDPSRAAQAICWLRRQPNVGPDDIHRYQMKHGGGITPWSRFEQTQRKKERGEVAEKKATAAARLAGLRKSLKDGQKGLLMVQMKGSTLASLGIRKLPKGQAWWPLLDAAIDKPKKSAPKSGVTPKPHLRALRPRNVMPVLLNTQKPTI